MNPREFLTKHKVHFIFVGAFFFGLAFNITIDLLAGQTVLGATWKTVSGIRPIDILMFAGFWYVCAQRPRDEWDSSLISLNLSRSNRQK
jgi:hypothetical protein